MVTNFAICVGHYTIKRIPASPDSCILESYASCHLLSKFLPPIIERADRLAAVRSHVLYHEAWSQMAADGRRWQEEIDSATTSRSKDELDEPYIVYPLKGGLFDRLVSKELCYRPPQSSWKGCDNQRSLTSFHQGRIYVVELNTTRAVVWAQALRTKLLVTTDFRPHDVQRLR